MKRLPKKSRPVEDPTFFIDLNIDNEEYIESLRAIGVNVVGFFDEFEDRTTTDDEIIKLCDAKGYTLLTSDKKIVNAHFPELKRSRVAMIQFSNNNNMPWAQAIVVAKAAISRHLKKSKRPFVARMNSAGRIYSLKIIRETDRSIHDSEQTISESKKKKRRPRQR